MGVERGQAFSLEQVNCEHAERSNLFYEFLRVPDLSMGLYVLPAGADDPQQPHNEDEVYYVISGRGKLRVEEDDYDAGPGAILYVAKHAAHKFHSISEELRVFVFFAPAHT